MRALLSVKPGSDENALVLSDIPEPQPGSGQLRIAVEAIGVNYPDCLIIEDRYQFRPERPFAPGAEFSGRIDAVGEGVTKFKVGDRVLSGGVFGAMAEKVVVTEQHCFAIPGGMPFDAAAAFLMTYGTSYYALKHRGHVKAGEKLLVLGAAGGVGLAAVELGKAFGAEVIAAVSTAEKAEVARQHGADSVIIYPAENMEGENSGNFVNQIRAQAPGGVDIVYDAVGGGYAEPALRSMAWEGRYLVIGFPAGIPQLPLNLPLLKGCSIVGVFWGASIERDQDRHQQDVQDLMKLFEDGHLRPLVSARFPLEQGGRAIARLATRGAVGKIVVTI